MKFSIYAVVAVLAATVAAETLAPDFDTLDERAVAGTPAKCTKFANMVPKCAVSDDRLSMAGSYTCHIILIAMYRPVSSNLAPRKLAAAPPTVSYKITTGSSRPATLSLTIYTKTNAAAPTKGQSQVALQRRSSNLVEQPERRRLLPQPTSCASVLIKQTN